MVDWASWFMEGPEEVVVGLGLDEDIRLSRSMSTPSELHVVCLLSSFWKTEKNDIPLARKQFCIQPDHRLHKMQLLCLTQYIGLYM